MKDRTTITVASETHELLRGIADDNGWSVQDTVRTAIEALETLLDLHQGTAAKAAEPDVGRLFLALSRLMPAGLVEGRKTEWGRLQDGRPVVIVDGWYFSADSNGEVAVIRGDGRQIAHIRGGRVEVVANVETVEEIAALN